MDSLHSLSLLASRSLRSAPRRRPALLSHVMTLVAGLMLVLASAALPSCANAENLVRVAVEVFRSTPTPVSEYDRVFGALSARMSDTKIQLAVGSDRDIAAWAAQHSIDLAIVTPETFSAITAHTAGNRESPWSVLAAERAPMSLAPVGGVSSPATGLLIASSSLRAKEDLAAALVAIAPEHFSDGAPSAPRASPPAARDRSEPLPGHISLSDFGSMLTLHTCTQPNPLRLALVFAGGGAKCSYQVGAVEAIEALLASLRAKFHDPAYDIALAAGTSGGALNALPVALGVSADPAGQADFAAVWQELDQRELIRPSNAIRVLMVLWFVCLQGVLLLRYRRARHFKNPDQYPWIISPLFVVVGLAQILLARAPLKPWSLLGMNSSLHHVWLWLSWGLEGSGWTLILLAVISQVVRRFPIVSQSSFPLRYRVVRQIFWIGIVLIPLVQTLNIFLFQSTLSDSVGIEGAVVRNFSELINRHLERQHEAPLTASGENTRERLVQMGLQLVSRHLLKRDLVLTGSALPKSTSEAPGDLYFFAHGSSAASLSPKFGGRGVSLDEAPAFFMDVLMGSGAIYPVFPARTLNDFPFKGQSIELVDGSFEHRSPVEAAVLWGATHILVVQAATDEVSPRGSFLDNIMAAMNHLYDQAQLLDFRSREQAVTVTLTPAPPHIGLLDFSDNLIRWSIEKGKREAAAGLPGASLSGSPYRKEVSEPVFWTPPIAHTDWPQCSSLAL